MHCERCQGLMVEDHFLDIDSSEKCWMRAWRCPSCGNVMDALIAEHRRHYRGRMKRPGRAAHRFPQSLDS